MPISLLAWWRRHQRIRQVEAAQEAARVQAAEHQAAVRRIVGQVHR